MRSALVLETAPGVFAIFVISRMRPSDPWPEKIRSGDQRTPRRGPRQQQENSPSPRGGACANSGISRVGVEVLTILGGRGAALLDDGKRGGVRLGGRLLRCEPPSVEPPPMGMAKEERGTTPVPPSAKDVVGIEPQLLRKRDVPPKALLKQFRGRIGLNLRL